MTEPPSSSSSSGPCFSSALAALIGREVVLDLTSPYVVLGRLAGDDPRYLVLKDADVHDLRDTNTTRDAYVLDSRRHGIQINRRRVLIRRDEVVAISALDDVLD